MKSKQKLIEEEIRKVILNGFWWWNLEATISVAWKIIQFVTMTEQGSQQPKGNKAICLGLFHLLFLKSQTCKNIFFSEINETTIFKSAKHLLALSCENKPRGLFQLTLLTFCDCIKKPKPVFEFLSASSTLIENTQGKILEILSYLPPKDNRNKQNVWNSKLPLQSNVRL